MSCNFHPCKLLPQIHVSHFQSPHIISIESAWSKRRGGLYCAIAVILKTKLPSIEDRGLTDRVIIFANPSPNPSSTSNYDLDF